MFHLKDKNPHPACNIYEGTCSCSTNYIGETKKNVETRWNEHLRDFPDHKFDWKILLKAPKNTNLRKVLESSIIALKRLSLNEQLNFDQLILFRNGVT